MKKLILLAVILLSTSGAFAQRRSYRYYHRRTASSTFTLQPKIGLNVASLTNVGADSRVGMVLGLEGEVSASSNVGISFGALYSAQGAKWSRDGFSSTTKLDYINVPVLANFYVAPGFALKLGLQPGFLVDDHGSDAKSVDLSIPIGISYQYDNFVIDGRYNWGITDVVDHQNDNPHNSVFQFTIGYKFHL
ncbi:MAG: porin family protein [Prevotella sp.]|jgi:hypothetical protein|nr:porin family protein [Prevotella sp.]MCI1246995.1 porin family protein [Prevotella sp.]